MHALDDGYVPSPGLAAYIVNVRVGDGPMFECRVETDLDRVESGVAVCFRSREESLGHFSFVSGQVFSGISGESEKLRESLAEEVSVRNRLEARCEELQREKAGLTDMLTEAKKGEESWREAFARAENEKREKETELRMLKDSFEALKSEKEAIPKEFNAKSVKNPIISPVIGQIPMEEEKFEVNYRSLPVFSEEKEQKVCSMCGNAGKLDEEKCIWCQKWLSKTIEIVKSADASVQPSSVWTCSTCKSVNLGMNQRCNRCRKKRTDAESIHHEEHWQCTKCGTSDNFEDDSSCYSCRARRSVLS